MASVSERTENGRGRLSWREGRFNFARGIICMSYLGHGASSPAGEAQGIGRGFDVLEWQWFEVNHQAVSQWAKFLRDWGEKVLRVRD